MRSLLSPHGVYSPADVDRTHAALVVDEYFEDLLSRPRRLARSTLRAYQWRLKGFSEYVCDRRYPWTVICEREFGRAPGQLFDERNLVAHFDTVFARDVGDVP